MFGREHGSKTGSAAPLSREQENVQRRERLRQLAIETVDINNDPYFMKNHLGTYECKLCLTIHTNEGSYLAHTQGKKHQQNLGRRAAKLAHAKQQQQATERRKAPVRQITRIGKPGYKVMKQRDANTRQRSLLFLIQYPQISDGVQPRHRFMSPFEQKVDLPVDKNYQYLLFAAEPYETVAFKIPNREIDRGEGRLLTHWDENNKNFLLQLYFKADPLPAGEAADMEQEQDEQEPDMQD